MRHPLCNNVIDLVVLTRDDSPLHPDVQQGITAQKNVHLIVHRVIGRRIVDESSRLPAIVRARNEGKLRGTSPWLMFLDDDVVLAPDCAGQLLDGLRARQEFAALGADYLKQSEGSVSCPHVAMGAVMFRRSALREIEFRWSPGQCECLCCCNDLRRKRMGIGYWPSARARHISLADSKEHSRVKDEMEHSSKTDRQNNPRESVPAYVLAAFDRRHCQKFAHWFIGSLRAAGNDEPVLAFAYGLYPSERRRLERLKGVQLIPIPSNGVAVPIRRLLDFQGPLEQLPSDSPVAYWDAGDMIFQDRLSELWDLARDNPERLLVVAEPFAYPENEVVAGWTLSIEDPEARKYAFELLAPRQYFNGGFAAATAGTMLRYLRAAHELRHSKALRGTKDWGDQTAMNLYCHSDPSRFLAVDDRWNYCICGRKKNEVRLLGEGRFVRADGRPISAVHGNGAAFVPYAFLAPTALARCSRTTKLLV